MNANFGYNYADTENAENAHCGIINNKYDKKKKMKNLTRLPDQSYLELNNSQKLKFQHFKHFHFFLYVHNYNQRLRSIPLSIPTHIYVYQ